MGCVPVSSKLFLLTSNQSLASYHYGNHVCQSNIKKKILWVVLCLQHTKQLSDAWLVNYQELVCGERRERDLFLWVEID